ncbi:MAG: TolC family protein [Muribaculaceae bacterium]|nr:TolC family protein [Muribaculaceae bacterium]
MRNRFLLVGLVAAAAAALLPGAAAEVYSLDSCRSMALSSNKEMMVKAEKLKQARYTRKEAFAAYLPAFDFTGGYFYNQKNLSIFDSDQHLPVGVFNPLTQSYEYLPAMNPLTGKPITLPDGTPVPATTALIPKEAMEFDIHNVFFGAVTLTQPIFMGGKIVALNKLARIGEEAASELQRNEAQNVIYAVDAAYWTVVSVKAKHELATSYVNLLDSLTRNVRLMVDQGVATRSDLLGVEVKLNEAKVDLLKVENGLSLSRMALAQICGLPVNTEMNVADEGVKEINPHAEIATRYDMEQVYANRPDLKALEYAAEAAGARKQVALSGMLPNIALIGAYSFSTPNMFDGFKNRVAGAFSVGVVARVPLWHWGGNYNKYKAAATNQTIMELQVADAKEKIELQVSQAAFKAQEAVKTYVATESNLDKAAENLRTATIGFREGVLTADDVMGAQTAWLKANSENIDAMIDVQLCDVYLSKVLGTLN